MPDYWPTKGWQYSTPEEQGMDSEKLACMLDYILENDYRLDSVHAIRNGYLVLEAHNYPFPPDTKHIIHSCTKSVMSALIGIAVDKGYLEDVNQRVLDIFSGYEVKYPSPLKDSLTLEHLRTMTTGLRSRDSYLYRWEGLSVMRRSPDWIEHILNLPMGMAPGTRFDYSNMASFLLSAIIQEKSGTASLDFARKNLFYTLGIEDAEWPTNPAGINIGWGELRLLPKDLAKIGFLYLHRGRWENTQIVPASWVVESTKPRVEARTLREYYGYQWWVDPSGVFMALGYAGQYLIVSPELNMVVVLMPIRLTH